MYLLGRLKVAMFGMVVPWLRFPQPFSFVGPGASLALCREIACSGCKRLLVITDGGLMTLGLADNMLAALRNAGVLVEVFSGIVPDPGYGLVMEGVERLNRFNADAALAIGGGSSIDGAKAMLLCHANRCHPARLTGIWLYAARRRKTLPFYAVPTTAGTGSEVTIAAVVSDPERKLKRAIIDPKVVPTMLALDPELMMGLPPHLTAATGMDALTHAVEAYVSTLATVETDAYALAAAVHILHCLPIVYRDGANLAARENMAVASCKAGMAFTRAGVGYVHAIAHQLGGLYHVPHGLANAIVLPYVLDYSSTRCARRLADLARATGTGCAGARDAELAAALIARIRRMNAEMGIPDVVQELRRADIDMIVSRAFAEAHGTYGVPRYLTRGAARALLERMLPAPAKAGGQAASAGNS